MKTLATKTAPQKFGFQVQFYISFSFSTSELLIPQILIVTTRVYNIPDFLLSWEFRKKNCKIYHEDGEVSLHFV